MSMINSAQRSYFQIALTLLLMVCFQASVAQQRKMLKKLRGTWKMEASIQYGDTLFNLANVDTMALIREEMELKKMAGHPGNFTKTDTLTYLRLTRRRLEEVGKYTLEFLPDSVYYSYENDNYADRDVGKYWLNENADTLYLFDGRKNESAEWSLVMYRDRKHFSVYLAEQRLTFIMRKN